MLEEIVKADWADLQIGEFMALFTNEQQVESMLKDGNALQSAATIDTELTNQFALALMQSWANTDDNYEGTERILESAGSRWWYCSKFWRYRT